MWQLIGWGSISVFRFCSFVFDQFVRLRITKSRNRGKVRVPFSWESRKGLENRNESFLILKDSVLKGTLVDNTACSRDRKTESCLRSGLGLVCGKSSSVRAVKGSSERVTQAGRKSYRQAYNRTLIEVMDDVAVSRGGGRVRSGRGIRSDSSPLPPVTCRCDRVWRTESRPSSVRPETCTCTACSFVLKVKKKPRVNWRGEARRNRSKKAEFVETEFFFKTESIRNQTGR